MMEIDQQPVLEALYLPENLVQENNISNDISLICGGCGSLVVRTTDPLLLSCEFKAATAGSLSKGP